MADHGIISHNCGLVRRNKTFCQWQLMEFEMKSGKDKTPKTPPFAGDKIQSGQPTREEPQIEISHDDRFSQWNDPRLQSKHMKGWRGDLWFEAKYYYWPLQKYFLNLIFGPWPLQLFIALVVFIYLVRKFLL
jgi:hypothetical protein